MCGIAGFTQFHHQTGDIQTLESMGDAIRHRGPDAGGTYLDERIGLSHRRLSIIDLSESGNQPMLSHDQNCVIVFNGEIYNFLELRGDMEKDGYPFQTHTDTEVILALYEKMGTDCLKELNGMFAFAIWDKAAESLFIARDRIGKKPLYYYQADNDIVFASELKAILRLDTVPREIRLDAIYDFFAYQYVPDPKTIFKDIFKLEPGHFMTIDADGSNKQKYWDISFKYQSLQSEEELKHGLQKKINDCTVARMISDVPLGAFLSGGVDSSGIVATMAKNSDTPVKTCSIGFDTSKFNETEFAQKVAEMYHTEHHELTVHQNVKDTLEHIVSFFDEPFADPSLVPTFFVSQLARQKVTVAIAGDGGDEVFAGYQKYNTDHLENKIRGVFPAFIRKTVFPPLAKLATQINCQLCRKAATLLNTLSKDPAMGFYLSNAQITDTTWNNMATSQTRNALADYHPSSFTTDFYQKSDAPDHLGRILYTDMKTYLPGGILVKVDRMSMASSLEVRAPILDYTLIEFAATIPSHYKFRDGEKKYILKEAFKEDLPDDILYRKKMGFDVPLAHWLRTELKDLSERVIFNSEGGLCEFFDMQYIKSLWDQHQAKNNDNSIVIWSILIFQMWWNVYMTPRASSEGSSSA